MKLSPDLQIAINVALLEAQRRGHEFAGLEHLLFALLHDPATASIVQACGASPEKLKHLLARHIEETIEKLPPSEDEKPSVGPTRAFQRVVNRAARQALAAGKSEVPPSMVLVALYDEKDSWAVYILEKHGVGRLDLVNAISHGPEPLSPDLESAGGEPGAEDSERAPVRDPLQAWAQDLSARAEQGDIDPLVGREHELSRICQILARRRKSNPLLVGEPGVGKTAIVEGLALRIHEKKVPEILENVRIWALDMGSLLAGTRYRGDFEARVKAVLGALQTRPGAILLIDDIHTVVGAGATSGGGMDASNLLKPALASGSLRCIGITTHTDWRALGERDRGLIRRFQKVDIEEPPRDEVISILDGLRPRYEEFHSVHYTREALESAVDLASRFLRERKVPDSAIDLLDEAGAAMRLAGRKDEVIDRRPIEAIVSRLAHVPSDDIQRGDRDDLQQLESRLKGVIFGQDPAIDRLVACVRMARAGLRAPEKPIGSFLLTGPTGTGKTELARQLAAALKLPLHRFDMSEYNEKFTVSRLVGSPPGYVGFEREGLLTSAVTQSPYCVVLLDEIEKACPEVFNLLLQVMDHGSLTDAHGRKADFRQVILLMTSNVGARDIARRGVGFGGEIMQGAEDKAYRDTFSPEFRNRLDARLGFAPLSHEVMERIVDKLLAEILDLLKKRSVSLTLSPQARKDLARRGWDATFGARPLARLLEDEIKRPLSEALLFGALQEGGSARVELGPQGQVRVICEPA